mmetsp:Transcript_14324/g.58329  ORF Transcript_14324/g.58329 Transcript_14324/m.58329 type:complete len:264 (-) Transcript_14324:3359-4150(-)
MRQNVSVQDVRAGDAAGQRGEDVEVPRHPALRPARHRARLRRGRKVGTRGRRSMGLWRRLATRRRRGSARRAHGLVRVVGAHRGRDGSGGAGGRGGPAGCRRGGSGRHRLRRVDGYDRAQGHPPRAPRRGSAPNPVGHRDRGAHAGGVPDVRRGGRDDHRGRGFARRSGRRLLHHSPRRVRGAGPEKSRDYPSAPGRSLRRAESAVKVGFSRGGLHVLGDGDELPVLDQARGVRAAHGAASGPPRPARRVAEGARGGEGDRHR